MHVLQIAASGWYTSAEHLRLITIRNDRWLRQALAIDIADCLIHHKICFRHFDANEVHNALNFFDQTLKSFRPILIRLVLL